MFWIGASHTIRKNIRFSDPQKSTKISIPSDSEGNYELAFTLNDNKYLKNISLGWSRASVGNLSCSEIKITASFTSYSSSQTSLLVTTIPGPSFPTSSAGRSTGYSLSNFNLSSAEITIEIVGLIETPKVEKVAMTSLDIHSTQCFNNVRIYFPSTQSDLWTTEAALRKASDHFYTLLSSDYSEGKILSEIRNDVSTYETDFEDSDDEEEDETVSDGIMVESMQPIKSAAPFKQIKIDAIAHSTYRAFLHWLHTADIIFAPLSSNFRLLDNPSNARTAAIKQLIVNPNLPPPVSPNSVYRLAHYYDIPTLRLLALDEIKSQLTVENIAFEVFGDLSKKYEEVREMEIDYTVKHWKEVSDSEATKEIERLAEVGEIDISIVAIVAMRLNAAFGCPIC